MGEALLIIGGVLLIGIIGAVVGIGIAESTDLFEEDTWDS